MEKIGVTIGKFAPMHKGHQFLLETALKEVDKMYVIVYETDVIKIPVEQRAEWIKKMYPDVNIIYAKNPPNQYGLDDKSVKIQMDYMKKLLKDINVTHFFSSEEYGKYAAKYLNAVDRRVDSKREKFAISATKIRNDIDNNKKYLEENVYKDFIIGSGKIC